MGAIVVPRSGCVNGVLGVYVLEDQRSDQLLELGYLTLGAVIVSAGLVALLITILRRERRDLSLAFFGCLSILVGLRFLINTSSIRVVLGGSPDLWNKGQVSTNYFLAAAALYFYLCFCLHFYPSALPKSYIKGFTRD